MERPGFVAFEPRAVLALHPVVALMGVCMVRIAYRMLYEHSRARITGGDAEVRRALVLGAGEAAKRVLDQTEATLERSPSIAVPSAASAPTGSEPVGSSGTDSCLRAVALMLPPPHARPSGWRRPGPAPPAAPQRRRS